VSEQNVDSSDHITRSQNACGTPRAAGITPDVIVVQCLLLTRSNLEKDRSTKAAVIGKGIKRDIGEEALSICRNLGTEL